MSSGRVILVAAGPGNASFLTVAAADRLATAIAVHAPAGLEHLAGEGVSLDETFERARAGGVVAVLVSGTGAGPEADALARRARDAGCEVERVAGVEPWLADALGAASDLPLRGVRVLVTRSSGQASRTARALEARGAIPVVLPAIRIGAAPDPAALERAARAVGTYDLVVFTSENGVERFFEALAAAGLDARAFGSAKIAAIGPTTARALEARMLRPDVVPPVYVGEELAKAILAERCFGPAFVTALGRPLRVLLPRAKVAREALPEALRAAGATVDVVAAYETHAAGEGERERLCAEIAAGRIHAVLLTSSSTAESFADLAAGADLSQVCVASIGPITSETARRRGLAVAVEAEESTLDGLVRALEVRPR